MNISKFSFYVVLIGSFAASVQGMQSDVFYDVIRGDKKALNAWLASHPDLTIRNDQGQSVLTFAAMAGNGNVVRLLYKAGALVNTLDHKGKTALDYVVERNNFVMARQLVQYGAKVTSENNALKLKNKFKSRAIKFFVAGWFFTPFLWIGTIFAINDASDVMILGSK